MPLDAESAATIQLIGRLRLEMGSMPQTRQHRVKYTPVFGRAVPAEYSGGAGPGESAGKG